MKAVMTSLMAWGFLLAPTTQAQEWSTNLSCFHGGPYDGWDRVSSTNSVGLGGALVSLSSGEDQLFDFTATPALAALTIVAEDPAGTITNGGTMRVTVPADWACRFATDVTLSISGNATGKVGAASYTDGGSTLSIPVLANFVAGDTLVISGLRLADLRLVHSDTKALELDFTGNGARDVYDNYRLTVRVLWPGGSYDGWDLYAMAEPADLAPVPSGTIFTVR